MKVILLENVKSHGLKGEVVEVSEGYAMNFLFPQHLAVEANETNIKAQEDKVKSAAKKSKKEELAEKKLAKTIDGLEVVIQEKADNGKLYGSVGAKEIAEALKSMKHKIDADWIEFESQKEVGEYEATVNFPSGFEARLTIIIEAK